jgi:uncharacterized membrane protein
MQLPTSNAMHQVVVHVPTILLLTAPVLVVLSLGMPAARRRPWLSSALTLMVLGTAAAILAVATGNAAGEVIEPSPAVRSGLVEHQALAETTTVVFALLTLGLAALLIAPRLFGHELESRLTTVLLTIYLILYSTGAIFLVHTALEGRRLARTLNLSPAPNYQTTIKEAVR